MTAMARGLPGTGLVGNGAGRSRGILLGLVAVGLLSGCAQTGSPDAPRVYDQAVRVESELMLAQAAGRAANAQESLALIQRSRTPVPSPAVDEEALPADLRVKTTVEWAGPASGILRDLARNVGYGFFETGNVPSNPMVVNVTARDQAVGRVLADVGLQVQRVATVIVDPNAKRIELRHEPGVGMEGVASAPVRPARAGQAPRTRRAPVHAPAARTLK